MKTMRKKILSVCLFLILASCVESPRIFAQEASDEISLHHCEDKKLGVKFLCNPEWEIVTDENQLFIVISSEPKVSMTIIVSDAPVIFMEQLSRPVLQEIGQYADGFTTEMVKLSDLEVIRVEGVAKDFPQTALVDFYLLYDFKLYSILFSVAPKERLSDFRSLLDQVISSFQFLPAK